MAGLLLRGGRVVDPAKAIVEVSNAGTDGYVIVDAVQLIER